MDLGFTLKRSKSIRRSSLQVLKTRVSFRFIQTLPAQPRIVKQLKKERDRLHQQLSGLNAALEAFAGSTGAATESNLDGRCQLKAGRALPLLREHVGRRLKALQML